MKKVLSLVLLTLVGFGIFTTEALACLRYRRGWYLGEPNFFLPPVDSPPWHGEFFNESIVYGDCREFGPAPGLDAKPTSRFVTSGELVTAIGDSAETAKLVSAPRQGVDKGGVVALLRGAKGNWSRGARTPLVAMDGKPDLFEAQRQVAPALERLFDASSRREGSEGSARWSWTSRGVNEGQFVFEDTPFGVEPGRPAVVTTLDVRRTGLTAMEQVLFQQGQRPRRTFSWRTAFVDGLIPGKPVVNAHVSVAGSAGRVGADILTVVLREAPELLVGQVARVASRIALLATR